MVEAEKRSSECHVRHRLAMCVMCNALRHPLTHRSSIGTSLHLQRDSAEGIVRHALEAMCEQAFINRLSRFGSATRTTLLDAIRLRDQLDCLAPATWVTEAGSQLEARAVQLEDAEDMLSECVTLLSARVEEALVSGTALAMPASSSAAAGSAPPGTLTPSGSGGRNKLGQPAAPVATAPASSRQASPMFDFLSPAPPPPQTRWGTDTPKAPPPPPPVPLLADIPPMPVRATPVTSRVSTGTLYTPAQLPYKAAPAALRVMAGMTLIPPTVTDPLPPRPQVVFIAPGAVARQEQARRSSSATTPLLGRRQPLEYGTTSDTALPRHGLPYYFEDSPTPGWKFVIGDLLGGTKREDVWHIIFLK